MSAGIHKFALLLAATWVAGSAAATAQVRGSPTPDAVQRSLVDLDNQVGDELRRGALAGRDAARLRRRIRAVATLSRRYAAGGFTAEELSELQRGVRQLGGESSGGAIRGRADALLTLLALSPAIWDDKPPPNQPPPPAR